MTCLISGTKVDSVIRSYQELKYPILQKHVGGWIYENIRKNFREKNINKIKKKKYLLELKFGCLDELTQSNPTKMRIGELNLSRNSHYVILKKK